MNIDQFLCSFLYPSLSTKPHSLQLQSPFIRMQKEQSFVNDELNTAFVDGDLNKTVSAGNDNPSWNLLDDPNILKDEEEEPGPSNILDFSEKDIKGSSSKNVGNGQSVIQQQKVTSGAKYGQQKVIDDDDDLMDLMGLFGGKKPSKPNKK